MPDLDALLANGRTGNGHRSEAEAKSYLKAVTDALNIREEQVIKRLTPDLCDYIAEVILSAAWYTRKYRYAKWKAIGFVALNALMVIVFPLGIAALGGSWSSSQSVSNSQLGTLVAQLTAVLTGLLAFQKTVSAWYSQQQNYAGWYKCSADLKEMYYSLLKEWKGKVEGRETDFVGRLGTSAAEARLLLKAERIDYYTRLALPTFDLLDMLTSSKSGVASLVTSLLPAERNTQTVAIGTKILQGQVAVSRVSTSTVSDVNDIAQRIDISDVTTDHLMELNQEVVDACASANLKDAKDVGALFGGRDGFFDWYNATFRNVDALSSRFPCKDTADKRAHFDAFWDQIPTIFDGKSISAIEFCALMAVNLEESSGDLTSAPEGMNGLGRPHPGLAYAFDKIDGHKQTYNHAPNRTALSLFGDPAFVRAHRTRPGARAVLERAGGVDRLWGGDTWPGYAPANVDESVNGFIMQADFYKFRGRGVIQTTWRSDYKLLIDFILSSEAGQNPGLAKLADGWRSAVRGPAAQALDEIATISCNADWDAAFSQDIVLAKGVSIDSKAKNNYLQTLGRSVEELRAPKANKGSLLYFAAHINGGDYPARVAPKMAALMCGIAQTLSAGLVARAPRTPEVIDA